MKRVQYGKIYAHAVSLREAIDCILERVSSGQGGYVVTPNVDHVCLAETDAALVSSYDDAFLSIPDGMPLVWMSRALGLAIREKVSGSDLVEPLLEKGAARGLRIYFLGASERVNQKAKAILESRYPGLVVVGFDSPMIDLKKLDDQAAVVGRIRSAKPQLLLVALGCPKQELWMQRFVPALPNVVGLGIGASLDFIAGEVQRAPQWMSRVGLEWAFRLFQEPKRLAHRYLVRDRAIAGIFVRMARERLR
jgi:N-acetylglucosaminyldiphosphoundecaprenol N-acetyl-beta-D-mannosaminyltransferase